VLAIATAARLYYSLLAACGGIATKYVNDELNYFAIITAVWVVCFNLYSGYKRHDGHHARLSSEQHNICALLLQPTTNELRSFSPGEIRNMVFISHFSLILSSLVSVFSNSPEAAPVSREFAGDQHNQQVLSSQPENSSFIREHDSARENTGPQPFYLIAHRVLTTQGVYDALSHGANAIELDVSATRHEWYADHDDTPFTRGDTVRTIFETVAEQRQAGQTITFVWLDIKTPDRCDPSTPETRQCSIAGLQDLAREILEPHGVRVQYGFYNTNGRAYDWLVERQNSNEVINLNGKAADVLEAYTSAGIPKIKRAMSYGSWILPFLFGNCHEDSFYSCTELRQATESRSFGKVWGWTTTVGHGWYAEKMLDEAGVDGLIYGFQLTSYYDHESTRAAARDILAWIADHPGERYLATNEDIPW
jgi:sphingomyelin phosphodiesterase D